ncbi:MAG: hypothetical protein ACI9NT_002184, partial [Bacteroidia bacterium]
QRSSAAGFAGRLKDSHSGAGISCLYSRADAGAATAYDHNVGLCVPLMNAVT